MRLIGALAAGVALMGATPESGKFDLDCKNPDGSPALDHYRIDLGAAEWCMNSCPAIRRIVDVTSGLIVLQEISPDDTIKGRVEVNRVTGELKARLWGVSSWIEYSLICERAPFSGFPSVKTKF